MNKVRYILLILPLCLMFIGCGEADDLANEALESQEEFAEAIQEPIDNVSESQSESGSEEADSLIQDAENEGKDNLDSWLGKYTFSETYGDENSTFMFMAYDIDIYKENHQYYANVVVNGHMTAINLKAKLYGNEEWVSLAIEEYNSEHMVGLSEMENTVLLSLGKQGEEIYTYWGVLEPLGEYLPLPGIYLRKETEEMISFEDTEEGNRLEAWIGTYTFLEELRDKLRNYDITIYEENGEYYGDLTITGENIGVDVKARIYGNEEWISLVLVEYNPAHKSGLEGLENGVLLSLRKQGEEIYTYWGGRDVTGLLNDDCFIYYDSLQFFEKNADEGALRFVIDYI